MSLDARNLCRYVELMVFTVCWSLAYQMKCPNPSQWKMTAFAYCNSYTMYFCLSNGLSAYTENCSDSDRGPAGLRIVYRGNFDHGNCSLIRYQPFIFSTIGNSDCVYLKSYCHEEGQVVYINGEGTNDRECGCDYTKGYTFLFVPAKNSSCAPSVEDCTCYKKQCLSENMILSNDSSCIIKNASFDWTYSTFKTFTMTLKDTTENVQLYHQYNSIIVPIVPTVLTIVIIVVASVLLCILMFTNRCMENKTSGERFPSGIETDEHKDTFMDYIRMIITEPVKIQKLQAGPLAIYWLLLAENMAGRNSEANSRKFVLGKKCMDLVEKTIMVVGATGAGKTTFIDALANYLFGINFNDPHRVKITIDGSSETQEIIDPTISQTDWITSYTIHSGVFARLDYTLNIVDTPGFGDTRGIQQDKKLIEQIRVLFSTKGEQGLPFIDAVFFVTQASNVRLTKEQKYIVESILYLFGNDIKDNFCTIITFADGNTPPVIGALEKIEKVPLLAKKYFEFNCCNLFPESKFYWEMVVKSCKSVLEHVKEMDTKSIQLSKEVLEQRKLLEQNSIDLKRFIDKCLLEVSKLQTIEIKSTEKNENDTVRKQIKDNEMKIYIYLQFIEDITNRLGEIALSPNVSLSQLIDLLIANEKQCRRKGYELHISTLIKYKEEVLYEPRLKCLRKVYLNLN